MTKTQTEQFAKKNASYNKDVNAMTVAEIERLTWQERHTLARDYAKNAVNRDGVDVKWNNAFMDAYHEHVMFVWSSKLKQLENARRSFKDACSGLTVKQANDKIRALATSFNFRGARVEEHSMEILRGDRDGGCLYWEFTREDGATVNPDDAAQRAYSYTLAVKISTSGMTYSPARMALVHKIHGELLEVVAEIEATMGRERVMSTWGVPELIEVTAPVAQ